MRAAQSEVSLTNESIECSRNASKSTLIRNSSTEGTDGEVFPHMEISNLMNPKPSSTASPYNASLGQTKDVQTAQSEALNSKLSVSNEVQTSPMTTVYSSACQDSWRDAEFLMKWARSVEVSISPPLEIGPRKDAGISQLPGGIAADQKEVDPADLLSMVCAAFWKLQTI